MKLIRRALSLAVAGVFAASMCISPAFAEKIEAYNVNVYGGNHGTVSVPQTSVLPGSAFSFDGISITLDEDAAGKYYVKGIREASVNNAYTNQFKVLPSQVSNQSGSATYVVSGAKPATITQDTDYVVAYGIKSQRVEYTVRYVDREGNEIAPADTYIGDVGDKPAPVAKYIEGYLPRAMSVTKELTDDPSQNVLTFDYVRLDPNYVVIQNPDGTYIIETVDGGTTVVPVTTTPAPTVVRGTNPAAGTGAEGADEAAAAVPVVTDNGEVVIDDEGNPLAAPVQEINLDDDQTPLASGVSAGSETPSDTWPFAMLSWLLPLLAGLVLVALVVFFALLIRNKRKEEQK